MPIEMRSFVRGALTGPQRDEVERVSALAEQLRGHLEDRETAINQAHVVGAQSSVIQAIVSEVPNRVGAFFGNERREVDVLSAHVYGYGLLDIKAAVELRPDDGS